MSGDVVPRLSDRRLTRAITEEAGPYGLLPYDFPDSSNVRATPDFHGFLEELASALAESELGGGARLRVRLAPGPLGEPWSLVEVYDYRLGHHVATGRGIHHGVHLDDPLGWSGVLVLARELLALQEDYYRTGATGA